MDGKFFTNIEIINQAKFYTLLLQGSGQLSEGGGWLEKLLVKDDCPRLCPSVNDAVLGVGVWGAGAGGGGWCVGRGVGR